MNRFETDGLNELKSLVIGKNSFCLDWVNREGSKCLIMNCDQLSDTHVGENSFKYYESLELKTLPSLMSIEMDGFVFEWCHRIVFESMNDWMNDEWDLIRLQSIILGYQILDGDLHTAESNELIMKSTNDVDDWLIRSSFSIYIQRRW